MPVGGIDLELLVNDLSLAGQFHNVEDFRTAMDRLMTMRSIAKRFGFELHCHRNMASAQVTSTMIMPQAIQYFERDQQRLLTNWLSKQGPFWDDAREHGPDDYLECKGDIVTNKAVGEAAYRCLNGVEHHLVSLTPSDWEFTPIRVTEKFSSGVQRTTDVINHWTEDSLETVLQVARKPLTSWSQLQAECKAHFLKLTFSSDCFAPLTGHPFAESPAKRIFVLLETLQRLMGCFDEQGQRTPEGHQMIADHFSGETAWFSDSSTTEKRKFEKDLRFPHPQDPGQQLDCTWHGKVQTPPYRIHFSWPIQAKEPVYVVYIGLKLTRI